MSRFDHIPDHEARRGLTVGFLSVIEGNPAPNAVGEIFGKLQAKGFSPEIVAKAYTTAYAITKDIGTIATPERDL